MSANNNREPWMGPIVDKIPDIVGVRPDNGKSPDKPTEDYLRGYEAGYDQAQFDLAQGPDPRTLRDEFAMAALPQTIAIWEPARNTAARIAQRAYEIANAMLTAREGKGQ